MSTDPNTTSSALNGPLWGERAADWAAAQEPQFRPVYQDVLTRCLPRSGMDYLDAGCGAGMAASLAASLGATVTGLDASEPLLAIARSRDPLGRFLQGDLEALPFADHSFDLVTGFNAFQYATHPGDALREARRVSRPGATIVIMTWGEPEATPAASLVLALRSLLPALPPGAPGPFALSKRQALTDFAESAGLRTVDIQDFLSPWVFPDRTTALRALNSSGVAARARAHSGTDAVDQAHIAALEPFLQPDATYRIPATFRCLFATT